jgi:hypothetical protein
MKVQISGIKAVQYETMIEGFGRLLEEDSGPLRLENVWSRDNNRPVVVKYLRSRTWGEYFYEKLWARTQDIVDAENAASAAIAHVFAPMINKARALKVAPDVRNRKEQTERRAAIDDGTGTSHRSDSVDNDDDNNNPVLADADQDDVQALKQFAECLQARVFERPPTLSGSAGKPAPASDRMTITSVNGLFEVPSGVSVCAASPLQFIANVVIVSSATDKSTATVKENATLRRALRKFEKAWTGIENPALPVLVDTSKPSVNVLMERMEISDGLHHVQALWCIADDDKRRRKGNPLDNGKLSQSKWKDLYLTLWRRAGEKGTVVQELYPNRWEGNPDGNGRRPVYLDANIWGAAEAGLEISSRTRKDGGQPASVMFTVADEKARGTLVDAIHKLASPPLKPSGVGNLPSPTKFDQKSKRFLTNSDLPQRTDSGQGQIGMYDPGVGNLSRSDEDLGYGVGNLSSSEEDSD